MADDQLTRCDAATAWTVCNAEYDDQEVIAAFTTRDLAEAFAKTKQSHVTVYGETVHNHIPEDVTYYCLSVYLLHDGTVLRNGAYTQAHWDCQLPEPLSITRLMDRDRFEVRERDQGAAEYAMFEALRESIGDRQDVLTSAERVIFGPPSVPQPEQYCYDASFGRVHYSASCRCKG